MTELYKLQAMYENFVTATVSKGSAYQYCKCLDILFRHFPDKDDPNQFSRPEIEDYKILRLREGVQPVTVNYELTVVSSFWKWMMDMGKTAWNPISQTKRLRTKEP